MSKHRCPDRCHKCPDLDGQVMPGCMGTAALAQTATDLSYCTCVRTLPQAEDEIRKLKIEIDDIRKTVEHLIRMRCDCGKNNR